MTESMLTALMKLFAILASVNKDVAIALSRNFVYSYLKTQFNQKIVAQSLVIFDAEISKLSRLDNLKESKRTSSLSVKVLSICREINKGLHIRGKYLIVISLVQFCKYFETHSDTSEDFRQTIDDMVRTIADDLMLAKEEFDNCRAFITEKFYNVPLKESLLVMGNFSSLNFKRINFLQKENMEGQLFFLKIRQADLILFYYLGIEKTEMGNTSVFPGHIYILPKGAVLKIEKTTPVYFSDVEAGYMKTQSFPELSFAAHEIEFNFRSSQNGIRKLSFAAHSGELFGVIGGSGTGKSTLLRLLTGSYPLKHGKILINGYDLATENENIKSTIAYVPQDDLLIEELTVYENLYYNAKLCLGEKTEKEIRERVTKYLNELDLFYVKDLKVGSPLNKTISGGQRKRLNIALELIREPFILLADEPTTGLSSTDSVNVMQLLRDLARNGKIVIINIHQPSSEIYKMLDRLLIMDKGGFPVFLGNPLDAFTYLKNIAERVDAEETECPACGNVQPDELLKVLESKHVNEFGEYTHERLRSPSDWYELFRKLPGQTDPPVPPTGILPGLDYKTPGVLKQLYIYSERNFLSKIADRQYALFALLIAPLLSILLAFFTRYASGNQSDPFQYIFMNNVNIPAYIFMSVVVALFVGLIISAEEIIRDSRILEREKFLNLSRGSYLNSKIIFLFLLSALQMLCFVLPGNYILGIRDMDFSYWLVLFSTSCFAIMLGLNISSALRSVIAIYITIPFVLVPLILLAGIIVRYDKLHSSLASHKYTPLVGDIMASRWAYEALMVNQFRNNPYQKLFYEVDRDAANISYNLNYFIPEIQHILEDFERTGGLDPAGRPINPALIRNSLLQLGNEYRLPASTVPEFPAGLDLNIRNINFFLSGLRESLIRRNSELTEARDSIIESLRKKGLKTTDIALLREKYANRAVSDMVLNNNEMVKIMALDDQFIRKDTPVYQIPASGFGRAQFYAAIKRLGNLEVPTLWFNSGILWIMTLLLYVSLLTGALRKFLGIFDKK